MYQIVNDKLTGGDSDYPITYHSTNNKNGAITPKFGVLHYTAGYSFNQDLRTLTVGRSSVQLLIGTKPGELAMIENFRTRLWHAGISEWKGIKGLNSHSFGIEVTCPGWLDIRSHRGWTRTELYEIGMAWSPSEVIVAKHRNGGHEMAWVPFNSYQMDVLDEVCPLLTDRYGVEWVGHDDVSPDRKVDPGPCVDRGRYAIWNKGVDFDKNKAPWKYVGENSNGQHVKDAQSRLVAYGFDPGPIDGYYGPKTASAILKFQVAKSLIIPGVVPGVIKKATHEALFGNGD